MFQNLFLTPGVRVDVLAFLIYYVKIKVKWKLKNKSKGKLTCQINPCTKNKLYLKVLACNYYVNI